MQTVKLIFFVFVICFSTNMAYSLTPDTPDQCLENLMQGNERFLSGNSIHADFHQERLHQTSENQEPFAIILACSDSRVAPEIVFDQSLGDLFVVRVAGNVAGSIELESVLYSALHLHSKLLLVMGHQNCGAVKAVLDGQDEEIPEIHRLIKPAIRKARLQEDKSKKDILKNSIIDNVKNVVVHLRNNPQLMDLVNKKKLIIQGAYYNFDSGKVELIQEKSDSFNKVRLKE